MYTIDFDPSVDKIIRKWKKSNPILFKQLLKIVKDIQQHPRTGLGHPEPLIGGGNVIYLRHINKSNRIVYKIFDDKILMFVFELEGHYNDK